MAPTYPAYELPQHAVYDKNPYSSANISPNSTATAFHSKPVDGVQEASRTPSPTPSERKELATGVIDWKTLSKWRFWIRREWLWRYVVLILVLVITALVTIFHTQIVDALTPVTVWLHKFSFGWLVPIGVLFVISFPPLFGHEIVAVLCGLVWGLWIGFGIVAAGTFIGEVGNFYAFKYCCRARGAKLERTKIGYACLAQVVREGGFRIALIARLSAIPGHFTTAVFSTCGMGIIVFSIAAILSLPKQFVTVYLGVILEQSDAGTETTKSKLISAAVVIITTLITIAAMWYIFNEMNKVKPQVIYARRKARQAKLLRAGSPTYSQESASVSSMALSPGPDDFPLTKQSKQYGILHINDSSIYAPQPKRAHDTTIISSTPDFKSHPIEDELEPGYHRYGHKTSAPRQSTDEVGWDMSAIPDSHRYPPGISQRPQERLSNDVGAQASTSRLRSQPLNAGANPTDHDTQYARMPSPEDIELPLPTPGFTSPFDDPPSHAASASSYYTHVQEPTDATYRTAHDQPIEIRPLSPPGLESLR